MNHAGTLSNRHGSAVVTLPSDTEVQIVRAFDAPAGLVWRAWTTPELVERWWASDRGIVTSIHVDLRVGGTWRYVMTANGGFEVAFHGEYREIERPRRLVSTEVFEMVPDVEAISTLTLDESDGVTTMTILVRHPEQTSRDAHINSGMEGGMQSSLDYIEDLIADLT
jgi:uncharacterized protein YndB with AHSA1/START domain